MGNAPDYPNSAHLIPQAVTLEHQSVRTALAAHRRDLEPGDVLLGFSCGWLSLFLLVLQQSSWKICDVCFQSSL